MELYRRVSAETKQKYEKFEKSWDNRKNKYVKVIKAIPGEEQTFFAKLVEIDEDAIEEIMIRTLRIDGNRKAKNYWIVGVPKAVKEIKQFLTG